LNKFPGRQWLVKQVRGTPLEAFAFECDEFLSRARGCLCGSYSQHNEDLILRSELTHNHGTYVDIGANYPIKLSNTFLFYQQGWSGLTLEPIPRLSNRHRRIRPRDIHLNAGAGQKHSSLNFFEFQDTVLSTFDPQRANVLIERGLRVKKQYEVPVYPLSWLINKYFTGIDVDILTIDTEGYDYEILKSNDWDRYRPKFVVFECDKHDGDKVKIEQKFMHDRGYEVFFKTTCNLIMRRIP